MSTDQPADAPTLDELGLGALSPDVETHHEDHQTLIGLTGEGERVTAAVGVRPEATVEDVEDAMRDIHLELLRIAEPERLEAAADDGGEA